MPPPVPLDRLSELLDDFKRLPPFPRERPTFLQVIHCLEIHWSNILPFFLDPTEVHGMGSLFLDALLKDERCGPLSSVTVEREYAVPAVPTMVKGQIKMRRGRIDLYIKADQYLIAVENKISSPVFGDQLKRYSEYVDSQASAEDLEPVKLLLSLKDPGVPTDQLWGFHVLRYESLIERVSKQDDNGDSHYRILIEKLFKTIDMLKGSSVMTPSHITFFRERTTDIKALLAATDEFRKVLHRKTADLASLMDLSLYGNVETIRVKFMAQDPGRIKDHLGYEIHLTRGQAPGQPVRVRVEARISPDGWEFRFKIGGRVGTLEELGELLNHCFGANYACRVNNFFVDSTTRFPFSTKNCLPSKHITNRSSANSPVHLKTATFDQRKRSDFSGQPEYECDVSFEMRYGTMDPWRPHPDRLAKR
jgi:hypothetical protein